MNTLYAEKLFAHPGDGRMPVVQLNTAEDAVHALEHQRDTLLEEAEQRTAQLAALTDEHEVLTNHARITDANLALLVEKVLAYEATANAVVHCIPPQYDTELQQSAAYDAEQAMLDLARSLKP